MAIPKNVVASEFGTDERGNPTSVAEEYRRLRAKIIELYDERVWFLTEAALAVLVSCLLDDIANPVGLILVDGASTEKTTVLDFFEDAPMYFRIDKFTPASLVSQAANVREKRLKEIDLLAKFPYRTVVVPELAPLFNQPKDELMETFGILARLFDGRGLSTAGGVHGLRCLIGDYLFGFLGATTPVSQTAWNTMTKIGSRLVFLNAPARLSTRQRMQRAKNIMCSRVHYKTKMKMARGAVRRFLTFLLKACEPADYKIPDDCPEDLRSKEVLRKHCGFLPRSVTWDKSKDDEEVVEHMALLAEFLTRARGDVRTWTEKTEDGRLETNSSGAVTEGVDRFASIIYNLARCHALVCGRDGITADDLPLIIAVTLSSLPDDRRAAVELLIDPSAKHKTSDVGWLTLTELARARACSDKTAKTIMQKLRILEIGTVTDASGSNPATFTLHDDYAWLTTEDFRQYYRQWDDREGRPSQGEEDVTF